MLPFVILSFDIIMISNPDRVPKFIMVKFTFWYSLGIALLSAKQRNLSLSVIIKWVDRTRGFNFCILLFFAQSGELQPKSPTSLHGIVTSPWTTALMRVSRNEMQVRRWFRLSLFLAISWLASFIFVQPSTITSHPAITLHESSKHFWKCGATKFISDLSIFLPQYKYPIFQKWP